MLRRVLLPVLALVLPALVFANPERPVIRDESHDVTAHGVVADGRSDNAAALQKLIDDVSAAGGGRIVFPAAPQPYLSGPFNLRSGIELHLAKGATLQPLPYGAGSNAPGTYPLTGPRYTNFIIGHNLRNIAITGEGTIDGNGQAWWDAFRADRRMPARPYLIRIQGTSHVLVTGVTLSNSPMFHLAFHTTNHVTIEGVTVRAPAGSPNTDGIDPAGSHYLIRNCDISTGDDNIAIKAGNSFCSDIVIEDCTFGTGHGLSIGGQTNSGLDGLIVRNCTFNGTNSGIRMKADPTQGGPVRNVLYENITMTNVKYPIAFSSYYNKVGNPGAGKHMADVAAEWNTTPPNALDSKTLPSWRNIIIKDLTVVGGNNHSIIWGLPVPTGFFSQVQFINLRYSGRRGFLLYNVDGAVFAGAGIQIDRDGPPFILHNSLVITRQPSSQRARAGGSVTFETAALASSGSKAATPTYRWTLDGQPLTDGRRPDGTVVSGATTAKLTLRNVQPGSAGRYVATATALLDVYDVKQSRLVPSAGAASASTLPAQLVLQ